MHHETATLNKVYQPPYEFEFIHPFADGNGRMGRLWQSLILTSWNPLFADLPVESLINTTPQVTPQVGELLAAIRGEMDRNALQSALGLSDRKSFRERYLKPALAEGLIEMTLPDKPNSRLQKYRLTEKARQWLAQHGD